MTNGATPEPMQVDAFNLIGRKEVEIQGLRDRIALLEAVQVALQEDNARLRDELAKAQPQSRQQRRAAERGETEANDGDAEN